jgi:nucleoside 2-deoxyribosyltransferase
MKVYIASRFTNRVLVQAFMLKIQTMTPRYGRDPLEFTQSWHLEEIPELTLGDHAYRRSVAWRDIEELNNSDGIIVLTDGCEFGVPGGMHFEAGYAFAKGKSITVIGPRVHVFYHVDTVDWYENVADYLAENYESELS